MIDAIALGQQLQSMVSQGLAVTKTDWQSLIVDLRQRPEEIQAFDGDPEAVEAIAADRWQAFQAIALALAGRPELAHLLRQPLAWTTLWRFWLPLAQHLQAIHQAQGKPLVQGILGGQGTGKTTLGLVLTAIFAQWGDRVVSLSIDDIYKTYADRQVLLAQDPRLIWRGPPGTHDVDLAIAAIDALVANTGEPVPLPRFNKSLHGGQGDRVDPDWSEGADLILFEGWFAGAQPVDPQAFAADQTVPSPIETEADRAFARDCNQRLRDYLPLWDRFDRLMVLHPVDYRWSVTWRQQAERERIAAGGAGMSDAEIAEFVRYFWQALHPDWFIEPLVRDGDRTDWVVDIGGDRRIQRIYRPAITGAESAGSGCNGGQS
jgi:D-glycerate 3-kinase